MKIIHIGNNFSMGSGSDTSEYSVYSKPDSTLLKDGKPFFIPDFIESLDYELCFVYKVCRLGKNIAERFAHRYYDEVTLGVSLVDTMKLHALQSKNYPTELATGFDNSSILGSFVSKEEVDLTTLYARLEVNSHIHRADVKDMKHSIDGIIADISKYYTLKIGDLVFISAPADCQGQIAVGQNFKGFLEGVEVLNFKIC